MFLFRWIKNLILFVVFIVVVLVVIIFFLPKEYSSETGIDIRASREDIFGKAQNLQRWHVVAMMGGISFDNFDIPQDINSQVQIPGVNVDTMLAGVRDATKLLKMNVAFVKSDSPSRIVYKVFGGPLNGMEPEVLLFELDEKNTKVTIKEKFTFGGLWGGIKVLSVRIGMNKLNVSSLENLKKLCEQSK
ncbi:hypothetical protein JNM05_00550 [bacterium]|nr:hypothetical protein [bacterium]